MRKKKKMAQGIKTYTASRYISVTNFNKLNAKEKEELKKELVERCKRQIEESKSPLDRKVNREESVNLMLKVEVRLRPSIGKENVDLRKIKIGIQ